MTDAPDSDLLAEFVRRHSETAFATIVQRHHALVYSVALRHTFNPDHAQDITQTVFIILARKATSLPRRTVLPGWLYHTARLTAANFRRAESRRFRREQEAFMQSSSVTTPAPPDPDWLELSPHLDAAMAQLPARDRDALVLRYFQNKSLADVGAVLRLNPRAAQKRVDRAVVRLRKQFRKRGLAVSAASIVVVVSQHSVEAAPPGLAAAIVATATRTAAAPAALTALANATMKTMAWLKFKFVTTCTVATTLAVTTAAIAVSHLPLEGNLTPQAIARKSLAAYAALSTYSDSGTASVQGAGATETTFTIQLQRPKLYRIDWSTTGGLYPSKGTAWSDQTGDYVVQAAADEFDSAAPVKMHDIQFALAAAGASSGNAATTIPAAFFNIGWGNSLGVAASGRFPSIREPDQTVDGLDCFVISISIPPANASPADAPTTMGTSTTKFWIGKNDHLIHRSQTTAEQLAPSTDTFIFTEDHTDIRCR